MNKIKEEYFLTEEEIEVVTERYYQAKVKHDKKVEEDRIKQLLKADKKEEKRILTEEELEEGGITKEEKANFREETLTLGREVSKLCYKILRRADYLISLYPSCFLSEQEKVKEDLYKIIYYFDDYQEQSSKRSKQWKKP